LIGTCLEKDAARRYQSARDLLIDLRQLQQRHLARAAFDAHLRHNLPAQLTSFIGRGRERAEVEGLLSGW
jgi:hypothetical protein